MEPSISPTDAGVRENRFKKIPMEKPTSRVMLSTGYRIARNEHFKQRNINVQSSKAYMAGANSIEEFLVISFKLLLKFAKNDWALSSFSQ
jgi:hypothetical protein